MERLLLHPLTHPPTITNIPRIDMWARVRSPGPLMADKAGARVTLYMLTSRSSGGEGEGVVRGKGSGGKKMIKKQLPADHWSYHQSRRNRVAWWRCWRWSRRREKRLWTQRLGGELKKQERLSNTNEKDHRLPSGSVPTVVSATLMSLYCVFQTAFGCKNTSRRVKLCCFFIYSSFSINTKRAQVMLTRITWSTRKNSLCGLDADERKLRCDDA